MRHRGVERLIGDHVVVVRIRLELSCFSARGLFQKFERLNRSVTLVVVVSNSESEVVADPESDETTWNQYPQCFKDKSAPTSVAEGSLRKESALIPNKLPLWRGA